MKHRIFPLILTGLGLMASVSATAKDVYAYTPNGEVLGKATEIKRIEFANGKMSLVPEIGEKTEIALSDLGYFAFKPLESSGVSNRECRCDCEYIREYTVSDKCLGN